jgi:hypothetical protein
MIGQYYLAYLNLGNCEDANEWEVLINTISVADGHLTSQEGHSSVDLVTYILIRVFRFQYFRLILLSRNQNAVFMYVRVFVLLFY